MSLSPNTTLAHYTIISKIGAGGMGEVYRARDTRLDREVAIKLLPTEVASDSDRLQRFEQEARATSALNHPNILTVYDIGTHDGSPYIVAELLEGEELRDRLDQGLIPLRKVTDYAQQIVSGLSAAHRKDIHRDLKPENLFITKDERVKILDFRVSEAARPQQAAEQFGRRNTQSHHQSRRRDGNSWLHVAGTGSGQAIGSSFGHLFVRLDPARDDHGT